LEEQRNAQHVETDAIPGRRFGYTRPGRTLFYRWRCTEMLLRGATEGHIGSWYDYTSLALYTQLGNGIAIAGACIFQITSNAKLFPGHYDAQVWDDNTKTYQPNADVGVFITVEETFDNNHRVVAQRGSGKGRFTFSAADSGEHRLCFTPQNVQSSGGWLGSSGVHGTVKFHLDMAIGETSKIESTDKGKIDDIVQKVRDLNSRLQDIKREQVFQRVCLCLSPET
jgi:hypothetical protein